MGTASGRGGLVLCPSLPGTRSKVTAGPGWGEDRVGWKEAVGDKRTQRERDADPGAHTDTHTCTHARTRTRREQQRGARNSPRGRTGPMWPFLCSSPEAPESVALSRGSCQAFLPRPWACGESRAARPAPRPASLLPPPVPCWGASPNCPRLFLSVIHSLVGNSVCGRPLLGQPTGSVPCCLWDTLVDPPPPSVYVRLSSLLSGPLPTLHSRSEGPFWKRGGRGLTPCCSRLPALSHAVSPHPL